jgi:hypothetical protein
MSPIINLVIYVTRVSSASSLKLVPNFDSGDLEKGASKSTGEGSSIKSIDIREGRPDISNLIGTATASADPNDRIIVGSCGPLKMVDQTRNAVSESMCEDGPSITLYTEVSHPYYLTRSLYVLTCFRNLNGEQGFERKGFQMYEATGNTSRPKLSKQK